MFKSFSWGVLAVVLLWASSFALALFLQQAYYSHSGFYYDSASYFRELAQRLQQAHQTGFGTALAQAFTGSNTAMPWVQAAFISLFTQQAQLWMGPAMQAPWILLFWLSLYAFFRRAVHQSRGVSLLMTLPFFFNAGLWTVARGWPNFTIDLMSYIVLGNGLLFYLWNYETKKRWPLVAAGILLGLSSWWRPVTLVYQVLILVPVELLGLILAAHKLAYIKRALYLAVPLAVLAGGYIAANLHGLLDYYLYNNCDSAARLPLSVSIKHFEFVSNLIGPATLIVACGWVALRLGAATLQACTLKTLPKLNLLALWCGLVPVGYLFLSGSGLNPFVCFPSVFGLLLFLLIPFRDSTQLPRWGVILLALLGFWSATQALTIGSRNFLQAQEGNRTEAQGLITAMTRDAQRHNLSTVRFAVASECRHFAFAWILSLIYHESATPNGLGADYQGIQYIPESPWAQPKWKKLLDENEPAKLKAALEQLDYICIPDLQTVEFFEKYNPTHPFVPYIRKFLAATKTHLTLTPISIRQGLGEEWYQLYRVEK